MIDEIICGDCLEVMKGIKDNSVDLVVTSPPYYNQKRYSHWDSYDNYLANMSLIIKELSKKIKNGRHIIWVIPDKIPNPPKENYYKERLYHQIYSDTETIASHWLIPEFPIVWKKNHATQRMFGSYPYPPTIIPSQMTERICIWRKAGKSDLPENKKDSVIPKETWCKWAVDYWEINADSRSIHPAPFPIEIPNRVIQLFSFKHDLILDPFLGSGTTAAACVNLNRHYIGIEQSEEYCEIAEKRVAEAKMIKDSQPDLFRNMEISGNE